MAILAHEIVKYKVFFNGEVDIVVTRTNKKTNEQYSFIIATIRRNGHVFIDECHLQLYHDLQDNECETVHFSDYPHHAQIFVKE